MVIINTIFSLLKIFSFDGLGFGLAFTASFLSGARWTFSQKVLQVFVNNFLNVNNLPNR